MDSVKLADSLERLGHPTRLDIFRLLVRAGEDGLPVGALQEHLGVPGSTLSHHLSLLVAGGLVRQAREGRVLRCTANYEQMHGIVRALTEECCMGVVTGEGRRIAAQG